MRRFGKTVDGELIIRPRWPARRVFVSDQAYAGLKDAQTRLESQGIRLLLTRGWEWQGPMVRPFRRMVRKLGEWLFCLIYPARSMEKRDIFSFNGHEKDGNSVDVRVIYEGRLLTLLPYGVFTPERTIIRLRDKHHQALYLVQHALEAAGFSIHSNRTEAMQIHCDLNVRKISDARQAG